MKNKIKIIISFILGIIATTVVGVYATNTFNSKDISYTNESTNVDNVSDAVDELYDKSLNEINTLKEKYKGIDYLADVVSVGDYVAYDAGVWTTSAEKPTSHGQFGGYTKGENKANSVSWCRESQYTTSLKGWRVYSIDGSTKTVTLIHAGQPECYYGAYNYAGQNLTNINTRADIYLNLDYANSAHMMTYEEADQNILRATGDSYWLATSSSGPCLWVMSCSGTFSSSNAGSFGVRPIVVLKPNILTTGKGTDMVGQEAWTLVKP